MAATLSTHVLNTARGAPAAGIAVRLYALHGDERRLIAETVTNADGRTDAPLSTSLAPGAYELRFDVARYFADAATASFFDTIPVRITIGDGARYHVPLLLSPWSYSVYRGS